MITLCCKTLLSKMVSLEILADTGHLTSTFKDCVEMTAKDLNMSYEDLARDVNTLSDIIMEYTREEDYEIDHIEEYMDKLGEDKLLEIHNMAGAVKRCMLADVMKAKEEME